MNNKQPLLFLAANAAMFQVGWLVCVGFGNVAALVFTLLASGFHLYWVQSRGAELCAGLAALAIGLLHDNVLAAAGVLVFTHTVSPPWLWCVWWLLGLTLRHSLLWVYSRPLAASLLGAISGCLSYTAGIAITCVSWGVPEQYGMAVVAGLWLLVLPSHRWLLRFID